MVSAQKGQKSGWFSKHDISLPLLFFLLASEMLSSYAFWALVLICCCFILMINHGKIRIYNAGMSFKIFFFMAAIGFFSCVFTLLTTSQALQVWPIARDMIKVSAIPLCCTLCSSLSEREYKKKETLYRTLFFFCSVYGIAFMLLSIPDYVSSAKSLFQFSDNLVNQWIPAVGIFFAFCKPPKIQKYYISHGFDVVADCGLVVLGVISFSRTVFLLLICLLVPHYYKKLGSILKILFLIAVAIAFVWSAFPDLADTFTNKIVRSLTEISSKEAVWDNWNIVSNWRGYEVYCAQEEFEGYNLREKLLGKGFGATVDVKGYAHLVTTEDSLPFLHNGYYTTLIKMGLVGVCLNIVYWIMLLLERKKHNPEYEYRTCLGVVLAMAGSMFVIHGVFWGGALFIPFLLLEYNN